MRSPAVRYLLTLLGLALIGIGLPWVLAAQGFAELSRWVGGLLAAGVQAMVIAGLVRWRHVRWVARLGWVVAITVAAGIVAAAAVALDAPRFAYVVAGVWAMAVTLSVGLLLVRLLLSPGYATLGVARTFIDEAIRLKVVVVLIAVLVVLVPVLPLVTAGESRLTYRLQFFLTWSMIITSALLSLMTLLLAAWTVSREIESRQVYTTLTKPVSRAEYLAGKWLGLALLNLVLVAVAGAGVYGYTRTLAEGPRQNVDDAVAVREQVLTARAVAKPAPPADLRTAFTERLRRLRQSEPETYGEVGDPVEAVPSDLRRQIENEVLSRWYALGVGTPRTYRFEGLGEAESDGGIVQLTIKPKAASSTADNRVYLEITANGEYLPVPDGRGRRPVWSLADDTPHTLNIPASWIDGDGVLEVRVINRRSPTAATTPTVTFNLADGVEVFYRAGSFEANLARSLLILWMRLLVLAALGLCAATFLGFPVAAVSGVLIYIAAAGSGYIAESVQQYAAFPGKDAPLWDQIVGVPSLVWEKATAGEVWEAVKVVVRLIGQAFLLVVPDLSAYNPTPSLADGRLVPWPYVGKAAVSLGLVWSLALGGLGYAIFRRRELARVTV